MATSTEALYVEVMQSVLDELNGYAYRLIHVALVAYAIREQLFLTFIPLGCDNLQYHFEWTMVNQTHCDFTFEEFQLTRNSQSERVFHQFTDIVNIAHDGLNVDI